MYVQVCVGPIDSNKKQEEQIKEDQKVGRRMRRGLKQQKEGIKAEQ